MEKKQSSIDYFFEEVVKWQMKPWLYASDGLEPLFEQAKQMEKEQIIQSYIDGSLTGCGCYDYQENQDGLEYYNKIYGGNND